MERVHTYQTKKNRKTAWIVGTLTFLFMMSGLVFWLVYPFPSDEKVSYFKQENSIIFNKSLTKYKAIYEEQVYLPLSFVKKHIDSSIRYDESSTSVIVTTTQKVFQMPTDSLNYFINNGEMKLSFPIIRSKQDEIYVATEWLEKVYPVKTNYYQDTQAVQVYTNNEIIQKGQVLPEEDIDLTRLRVDSTLSSPYITEVRNEDSLVIEGDTGDFFKVRLKSGVSGYLKKSVVKLMDATQIKVEVEEKKAPFEPTIEWPIHVTWDGIYKASSNNKPVPALNGVQVISPTWFEIKNGDGDIRNIASKEYVKKAKQNNFRVWALFSNGFETERTHESLATFEKRSKMIKQLLSYAEIYDLDGINIDFENVYEKDGPLVTQFVREFTPLAHEAGLVVSMDITFISNSGRWSKFYERSKLAESVDYLMVMAYDEHWGKSPKAGSVSSLPWVERNLERLLKEVPHDRLILGVPMYTRLWKIETQDDGTNTVSSKALSMDKATEWVENRNITPLYDPSTGQDYVEFDVPEEDVTYKMWLENKTSLQKRARLVHQYQLAGIASWSKYFANEEAWDILDEELSHRKIIEKTQ